MSRVHSTDLQRVRVQKKEARTRVFKPLPVPRGLMPLVQQYFELLNERELTLTAAARAAGLEPLALWGWKTRRKPTLENMVAAYGALGLVLVPLAPKAEQSIKPVFDGQSTPAPMPVDTLRPIGHITPTPSGTVGARAIGAKGEHQ